jgi:hypothetical protein
MSSWTSSTKPYYAGGIDWHDDQKKSLLETAISLPLLQAMVGENKLTRTTAIATNYVESTVTYNVRSE